MTARTSSVESDDARERLCGVERSGGFITFAKIARHRVDADRDPTLIGLREAPNEFLLELLDGYQGIGDSKDEIVQTDGRLSPDYAELVEALRGWSLEEYEERQVRAELALLGSGITFNV